MCNKTRKDIKKNCLEALLIREFSRGLNNKKTEGAASPEAGAGLDAPPRLSGRVFISKIKMLNQIISEVFLIL